MLYEVITCLGHLVVHDLGQFVQSGDTVVAAFFELSAKLFEKLSAVSQGADGRVLGGHRGAGHHGIVKFDDAADPLFIGVDKTHPPAGHGIRFGKRTGANDSLPGFGDLGG